MNSLFQQLQANQANPLSQSTPPTQSLQQNPKLFTQRNNLKQILNSSNPQEMIQNMISSNPKLQSVMQLFQNSKLTPKQFFYQYAQQNGIDPDQFINSLKQE